MVTKLTVAQRRYAIERAKGSPAIEAYRTAYPRTRSSNATVKKDAQRLERKSAVVLLIRELSTKVEVEVKATAVADIAITRGMVIAHLWDNSQRARSAVPVLDSKGNPIGAYKANLQASNMALSLIGKEIGMFRDTEHEDDLLADLSHEQVKALKAVFDEIVRNGVEH